MKSTLMKKTLGLLALGLIATGAQASWDRDEHRYSGRTYPQSQLFSEKVDARQDRQKARIMAGMREGRLSRAEFRRLKQEQREIRAMERYFYADGFINPHEFRRLDRALDIASHNIRAEMHDRQARSAYGHPSRFN